MGYHLAPIYIDKMSAKNRIIKIFGNTQSDLDVILIKNSSEPFIDNNFFYVSDINQGIFEESIAILHQDGNYELITAELESESAIKSCENVIIYKNRDEYESLIANTLSKYVNIGLNYRGITLFDYFKLKKKFPNKYFVDVSNNILNARMTKEEDEIEKIRKACRISDKVMNQIASFINEKSKEYEIASEINYLLEKNGADSSAFDTISSFGFNTSLPHYTHGDQGIRKGDFLLFDFGARFKRYNSDITRTFVYSKASDKQKEIYETVKKAQEIGFNHIKTGIEAHEVHDAVYNFINDTRFKGRFIHSTGHSLGLSVHDGGVYFNSDCKTILQENMILTVEPGIYIPGYGGVRIEDDVLIKKNGIEILTTSERDLIQL